MLKGLTLGSYLPGDSLLHNLDPRTKVTGALMLVVGTLLAASMLSYIVYSLAAFFILWQSGLSLRHFFRGMYFIYVIIVLSFIIQAFSIPGDPLISLWGLTVTLQGVQSGALLCWRLLVMITFSFLVTYTTTSTSLSMGIEKILHPLSRLGLPVNQLAMMMGITISFIPVMLSEFQTVINAQQSRGAGFGDRNLRRQFKNLLPLFIPAVAGILRRADELSEAMESRCYRPGAPRTAMNELKLTVRDGVALSFSLVLLMAVMLIDYVHFF